jgi:tripartite-type tricarboxylate transporter receptor subunit TctC
MFRQRAGIDAVHVPYAGAGPAVAAVAAGEAQWLMDTVGTSQPLVADGRLRGLAVTGPRRAAAVPEVPTLDESGYPGFNAELWFGLLAPAGTPDRIIELLNAETMRFLARPETQARLAQLAFDAGSGGSDALANRIRADQSNWTQVIRETKIRPS